MSELQSEHAHSRHSFSRHHAYGYSESSSTSSNAPRLTPTYSFSSTFYFHSARIRRLAIGTKWISHAHTALILRSQSVGQKEDDDTHATCPRGASLRLLHECNISTKFALSHFQSHQKRRKSKKVTRDAARTPLSDKEGGVLRSASLPSRPVVAEFTPYHECVQAFVAQPYDPLHNG